MNERESGKVVFVDDRGDVIDVKLDFPGKFWYCRIRRKGERKNPYKLEDFDYLADKIRSSRKASIRRLRKMVKEHKISAEGFIPYNKAGKYAKEQH